MAKLPKGLKTTTNWPKLLWRNKQQLETQNNIDTKRPRWDKNNGNEKQ